MGPIPNAQYPILKLLRQIKSNLGTNARGRPSVRVGYQGVAYIAVKIELDIQFVIHGVADVGTDLDVDITVRDGVHLINLSLNGTVVCYAQV